MKKYNNELFIKKSREIHGDKYNYDFVEYINYNNKVKIECSEHGIFEQSPSHHFQGEGCLKCFHKKKHQQQKNL